MDDKDKEIASLAIRVADLEALTKTQAEMLNTVFDDVNNHMQHITKHMAAQIKKELQNG